MKKRIILSTICILVLSFLFHSVYKLIPNFLTSIIFPVNESIWEHGKMIFLSFFTLFLIRKYKFKNNFATISFLTALICTVLIYFIFSFIYFHILKTNDNILVTIIIYTICILLSFYIEEKYFRKITVKKESIGLIGFIIVFIIYGVLTYYPIKRPIFYDYDKEIYGISSINK